MRVTGISPLRRRANWSEAILPLFLLLSAFLFLLTAIALLVVLEVRGELSLVRSLMACVVLLLAVVQGMIARDVLRQNHKSNAARGIPPRSASQFRPLTFVRWMIVGTVLSYSCAASLSSGVNGRWIFATELAAWYTLAWLPLTPVRHVQAFYQSLLRSRSVRRISRVVAAVILIAIVVEMGLRGYAICSGKTLVEHWTRSQPVASSIESSDSTTHFTRFHVVAIGPQELLSKTSSGITAQLEQLVPGTEVSVCSAHTGPSPTLSITHFSLTQSTDLALTSHPDLVLLFISLDEELTRSEPTLDWLNWRQSHLAQAVDCWITKSPSPAEFSFESDGPNCRSTHELDPERHLLSCERRLLAYRTPLDDGMRDRWNRLEQELATAKEACRQAEIPLAIVLVPSEFQFQRNLSDAARQRLGWEAQQVDLELPRRRLASLATQHNLSVYDLSPGLAEGDESPFTRHSSQWNSHGVERVATSLGRWLHARYGTIIASAAQAKTR